MEYFLFISGITTKKLSMQRAQQFNQTKRRYLHMCNDSKEGNNISKEEKRKQKEKRTEEGMWEMLTFMSRRLWRKQSKKEE